MNNFIYANKCEIMFGDLAEAKIAEAISCHGAKMVMVVYGGGSVRKSGVLDKVLDGLKNAGIKFIEFGGVCANPLINHCNVGVDIARTKGVDFVLAVGGGSVIDAAKYIAVGACSNQDVEKMFKNDKGAIKALKIGTVLTLPAAGSECSRASVVRCEESGEKFSMSSDAIRPTFAYINPRHCMTLPREQIANGASDIVAHMLERFFSPQTDVTVTDELLLGGIKALVNVASRLYNNPQSYEFWAEFCLIGTLAHNGWLSVGRDSQDWATHKIENKLLSGIHNIAHGQGLAILFPAWMQHNMSKHSQRFNHLFSETFDINGWRGFFRSLGLAQTLSEVGIDVNKVQADAKKVFPKGTILGAFSQTSQDDILAILEICK